ncbi:hypothetical protein [Nocardia aurea]|uniref:hypothetical protein n=1 Tax=Nocardia aurea TaxID=2144174 RepID=UPI0033ADBB63
MTKLTLRRRGIAIVGVGFLLQFLTAPGVAGEAAAVVVLAVLVAATLSAASYGGAKDFTGMSTGIVVVSWVVAVIAGMAQGASFGLGVILTIGALLSGVGNNQLGHGLSGKR